jgi:hypothetical protein
MGLLGKIFGRRNRCNYYYPVGESISVGSIDPKHDRVYRARSRSRGGKTYEVNVQKLTCTCPDFSKRRSGYPAGDVRRVCSHIYDKLYETKVERGFDPIVGLIIRYRRKETCFHHVENGLGIFVFGFKEGAAWVKVFAKIGREQLIGSYNLDEDRWAYGDVPKREKVLKQQIREVFRRE